MSCLYISFKIFASFLYIFIFPQKILLLNITFFLNSLLPVMLFPRNIGGTVTSGYWFILRFFRVFRKSTQLFFQRNVVLSKHSLWPLLLHYPIHIFLHVFWLQVKFYFPKFSWKKVIWYILKPKILNYEWLTTSHNNQK